MAITQKAIPQKNKGLDPIGIDIECPVCGRKTIVAHNNLFQCLNCNFRQAIQTAGNDEKSRDVSPFEKALFVFSSLLILAVLMIR